MRKQLQLARVRIRDSIHVRSVALTTGLIAAIVAFLTIYFPADQIEALEADQLARVGTYGDLLSGQLRSAVAFSDPETAREVMSALEADPDVVSSVLYDDVGNVLTSRGTASAWVERARLGVRATRVFATDRRVAVVAPVTSLEGPRGTLVIELSGARLAARQNALVRTAVAVALAVIVVGAALSWLITRVFVRRLHAIGTVASEVAAGATQAELVVIDTWDEIGVLGSAFNRMVLQLQEANRGLETRVEQRTRELSTANQSLVSEMARRSEVELELRQAQKLESVGRLAAGVAHEINTPVQFVSGSVDFVRLASMSLLDAVQAQARALEALQAGAPAGELLAAAETALAEADLEFVRDELPLALERTVDGLERVAVIVRSMKVFSHQNAAVSAIDLNKGVASTLTIARHEYKDVADVQAEYGELPPVVCEAGEINQVILNVVLNAAHAISDVVSVGGGRGTILVRTWADTNDACILIADTGGGIPEAIRERIYDPFFTTKGVGRGTGQGLAIARSVVVDKHGGSLTFNSELGRGTEFVIRLPLRPPAQLKVAA